MLRMVEQYLYYPIRLHYVVLNELNKWVHFSYLHEAETRVRRTEDAMWTHCQVTAVYTGDSTTAVAR
jgi:hypothetical protein